MPLPRSDGPHADYAADCYRSRRTPGLPFDGEIMKVYPGLIASDFLITKDGEDHAFQVWLWDNHENMRQWSKLYVKEVEENANAFFSDTVAMTYHPFQFLGHLHFVKDSWNTDTVAHELMHALFRYLIVVVEDFSRSLYAEIRKDKEALCYEFGYWMEWTFNWLFDKNPQEQWQVTNKESPL